MYYNSKRNISKTALPKVSVKTNRMGYLKTWGTPLVYPYIKVFGQVSETFKCQFIYSVVKAMEPG